MKNQQRIKKETDRQLTAKLIGDAANNLDTVVDQRFEFVQVPANVDIPQGSDLLITSIQAEYGLMILLQILVLMTIWFRRR